MIALLKAMFGLGGKSISPQQALARMEQGAVLLDVREPHEFAAGHARHARSLPLSQIQTRGPAALDALKLPDDSREILLICQHGMRSRLAQSRLAPALQHPCLNVSGGMAAWTRARLPLADRAA